MMHRSYANIVKKRDLERLFSLAPLQALSRSAPRKEEHDSEPARDQGRALPKSQARLDRAYSTL
jgi:hypothetical protein